MNHSEETKGLTAEQLHAALETSRTMSTAVDRQIRRLDRDDLDLHTPDLQDTAPDLHRYGCAFQVLRALPSHLQRGKRYHQRADPEVDKAIGGPARYSRQVE